MSPLLLAALLLHPTLADEGHLRLVAVGTGDETVTWSLDGKVVATTRDGEAARVPATAGPHDLWASSESEARWRALARPDDRPAAGAEVVPAWTAVNEPAAASGGGSWMLPAGALAGSVAVLVRPQQVGKAGAALRSLLQALRRPRRP
ncbi:MAG: hypothetical protein ACYC2H_10100 [Thermoplasmatota archaeon]